MNKSSILRHWYRCRPLVRAAQGVVLALIAPAGWWLIENLRGYSSHDVLLYLYMSLGTVCAFGMFGWLLGKREATLQAESLTDELTGLYNRRFFDMRLLETASVCQRSALPLSLVIFDLDHFKNINDRYGHLAGDRLLQDVGGILRSHSRHGDVVARVGGEEFSMLLPGSDREHACQMAERVRQAISESRSWYKGMEMRTNISAGVATAFPVDDSRTALNALVARADQALYAAKSAGRDQVVAAR